VFEALYAAAAVRGVLRDQVRRAPPAERPLTAEAFARFYAPLALTPLILFVSGPIATGAMSRMPCALDSLAAWPVVNGLVFTLRAVGFALNEVVVALLERPGARPALRRFTRDLAVATTVVLGAVAATPLAHLWFSHVSALPPALDLLGRVALWFAVPLPALSALQSYYQGTLLHAHRTRGITEAVAVYLAVSTALLAAGVWVQRVTGLHVNVAAMTLGTAGQVLWLRLRAGRALKATA
jgi:hypothetical protein